MIYIYRLVDHKNIVDELRFVPLVRRFELEGVNNMMRYDIMNDAVFYCTPSRLVWCDMMWYDMIWYDVMIWYDMIWYDDNIM